MNHASDDLLQVRGLSALLPPNEPHELEGFDLEVTLEGGRALFRISNGTKGWTMRQHMRTAQGAYGGESGPFSDVRDAIYSALIGVLMDRLMDDDMATHHPGYARKFGGSIPPDRVESADEVFRPLATPPRPAELLGPSLRPDDSRFLRAVPGPNRSVPYEGGQLRVLFVELYEEGIAIHWHVNGAPRVREEESDEGRKRRVRVNPSRFWVIDNMGTRYRPGGGGTQFGSYHVHGHLICTPGVPSEASYLNVTIDGSRFRVDLSTDT